MKASLWPFSLQDALSWQPPWVCTPLSLKPLYSSCPSPPGYPCLSTLFNCPAPSPSSRAIGLCPWEPQSYIPASLMVAF